MAGMSAGSAGRISTTLLLYERIAMPRQATFAAEELARAGCAVVADAGWSGLTMRAAAARLGVSAMALYRVVPDSGALQRLVAEHVGVGLPVPAEPLLAALGTWARTAHDRLRALPGTAAYLLANWTEVASWLAIVERFLQMAEAEGLGDGEAVGTVNAVFAYTLARAQLRDEPSTPRQLAPLAADPERFPLIRANLAEFAIARREEAFAYGLEALLEGLEVRKSRTTLM